jgi:hypothetical protein
MRTQTVTPSLGWAWASWAPQVVDACLRAPSDWRETLAWQTTGLLDALQGHWAHDAESYTVSEADGSWGVTFEWGDGPERVVIHVMARARINPRSKAAPLLRFLLLLGRRPLHHPSDVWLSVAGEVVAKGRYSVARFLDKMRAKEEKKD